jgi:hypothetical protein
MKRAIVIVVSLLFLALTWAALDDITTGSQPSFVLEWGLVVASAGWFAALLVNRRRHG